MAKIVFIMAVLMTQISYAFTLSTSRLKFETDEVLINVAGNDCVNAGLSASAILSTVQDSVDEHWNQVATARMHLKIGSVLNSVDTSSDDINGAAAKSGANSILIGCSGSTTEFTSSSTLAIGGIGGGSGSILGVVLINDTLSGGTNRVAGLDKVQLHATLAHEIGHALGIGHSSDPVALMYYSVGGKTQENLSQDDWDALTYLYPHPSPGGCGTIAPINNSQDPNNWPKSFLVSLFLLFFTTNISKLRKVKISFK